MYKIFADDILIYDDTSSDPYYKVASPTLTLELGAAGSLKMTIPPGNAGYETIERMSTTIRVEKDGGTIWEGRVLQEDGDFWNQRILFCEGALAYLNDSVQEQRTISFADYGWGVDQALGELIDQHNNHVTANRRFVVGTVTVMGSLDGTDFTVDYGSTIEAIQKNLIGQYGGYLHVRFVGGTRYLDYLEKPGGVTSNHNTQVIEFGKNLMDFTKSFDASEFATVLLPLGAKQGDSDSSTYLTVASENQGSIYVENETAVNNYGRIEKVIHFDDVNDPAELLQKATLYLSGLQFDKMQISLTAFDLHYLNSEIEGVKLGESIRVKSAPHGLDTELPVQKLDIPLDRPQDTAFELGGEIKVGFTSASNQINEELFMQINQAVDRDAILDAASAHVTSLMSQILNGYITLETNTDESGNIHSEALYISPQPMSENPQNYWRWSMNGLGYTSDGGAHWDTAILMDGTILGERIAAASIHGTQISADAFTLVTSAGQGALTMRVAPRVLAPDAFEVGKIKPMNPNAGTNVYDSKYARTKGKIRLEKDSTLYVGVYKYEVFEYSNDASPESGFLYDYGQPSGIFTVPRTNYYRLVLSKDDNSSITADDLAKMPEAVSIDGVSTVISADDLKIVGCVRFEDLSGNGTTTINGANIMTGTVTAEKINAYGLTIKKRRSGDEDDPTTWTGDTTFEIKPDGSIYIDAQIDLSASSQISFSGGTTTLGDMINGIDGSQEMAAKIADGQPFDTVEINGTTYKGTFINGQNIYSPNIYANVFTAQPLTDSTGQVNNTGAFILKGYYNGDLHDVFKVSFIGGGSDISTTYIESWGDTISLPHVIELRDDGTSANTGAYIRAGNRGTGNTLDSLIRYATLQGAFKVDGVLNTGGGGNSSAFLVVNNGIQSPEDYFSGRTVPVGTVYFQWAY